jgi:uncharacterized membrane protein
VTARSPFISARELLLAGLVATLAVVGSSLVLAGHDLWARPFWLDETLTFLIASDPSPAHAWQALSAGMDTNPPGLHATLHVMGNVLGHRPLVYRATMLLAMSMAVWLMYWIIRRHAGVQVALVASLTLAATPLAIHHATDARFYAPMLATTLAVGLLLDVRRHTRSITTAIALAICSAYLVSLHYFGIAILVGLIAGEAVWRSSWKTLLRQTAPTLAGAITLAMLLPLLMSQRAALREAGGTWMSTGWLERATTAVTMLAPLPMVLAVGLLWAMRDRKRSWYLPAAPLATGLIFFAAMLLVFDVTVQPVLVGRYLLPVTIAIALLVAGLSMRLSPRLARVVPMMMAGWMLWQQAQRGASFEAMNDPRSTASLVKAVESTSDLPVFSEWRGYALPLSIATTRPVRYLLQSPEDVPASLRGSIPFEQAMADINRRFYNAPQLAETLPERFVLVTEFPESIAERFAGYRASPVSDVVFELQRDTSSVDVRVREDRQRSASIHDDRH